MKTSSLALAPVIAALLASTANAQSVSLPPRPSERDRPEFDPVGGRVGSFVIRPEAELRIEYDDNVLALPDSTADDTILTLRGQVVARSLWQRHRLRANAYVQRTVHAEFPREDELEAGLRTNGTLDIDRRSAVDAYASVDYLAEDRTSPANFNQARERTRFMRYSAGATYWRDFDPLRVQGEVQATRQDFQDTRTFTGEPLEQDFRDTTYVRASGQGIYDVSPRVGVLARVEVDRLDYTADEGLPFPLDRDSTGVKLEAGVRMELTSLIRGEIRAGWLTRNIDDPQLNDPSGVSFGANLRWAVTPLTSVELDANRSVEEGGSRLTAGNLRSQAQVTVEHELLRNLVVIGRARVARIDTVGLIDDNASEYQLDASATYLVNRNLRVYARAERFDRSADGDFFREFARNRFTIGMRLVY
ncbi:outer membrane beta-barrel protein [Aurantiacibacter poecillastricola]|uniref:outer membrane beta-barrel protein n=1 Tax=Aurantiacibacter poecillastricola TaxID=3064385 RepID=UPI00273E6E0B|nr:outer membrane beta-barrel protein [Aurantiacibacter sp. 219JJ12-13]MDP5263225.1 outer membrane beta-barrel protein [Aurantiacibacter sp. 219JJ12-13]